MGWYFVWIKGQSTSPSHISALLCNFVCISFACSSHRSHRRHRIDSLCSVAEGGESCLTSGDRREPEDKYVYIKTSSPSLGKAERGGRGKMWWGRYSSGSFQSPEVKHNSPPSATSEHSPLTSIIRTIDYTSIIRTICVYNNVVLYPTSIRDGRCGRSR